MSAAARAASERDPAAARATISRLGGPGDPQTLAVAWNPSSYAVKRASRLVAAEPLGGRAEAAALAGGAEEFRAELFVDTTGEAGERRDGRRAAEILRAWMDPLPGSLLPPRVLFAWGTFRFAGAIAEVEEEWVRFDPDGTPVRGRIRLVLRS